MFFGWEAAFQCIRCGKIQKMPGIVCPRCGINVVEEYFEHRKGTTFRQISLKRRLFRKPLVQNWYG